MMKSGDKVQLGAWLRALDVGMEGFGDSTASVFGALNPKPKP